MTEYWWVRMSTCWLVLQLVWSHHNTVSSLFHICLFKKLLFKLTQHSYSQRWRCVISQSFLVKRLTAVVSTLSYLNVDLWSSMGHHAPIQKPVIQGRRFGSSWAGQGDVWPFLIVFLPWRYFEGNIFWAVWMGEKKQHLHMLMHYYTKRKINLGTM